MKAYTKAIRPRQYRAVVQEGNQYFTIGTGPKDHCDFLVAMFEKALTYHDAAVAQSAERLPCKQDVGSANLSSGSRTSWGQSVTALWEK